MSRPFFLFGLDIDNYRNRVARFIPPADTPQGFAKSVIRLLTDKTLQDQLSTNVRYLVESKYDWQVTLKDLEKVYERLG